MQCLPTLFKLVFQVALDIYTLALQTRVCLVTTVASISRLFLSKARSNAIYGTVQHELQAMFAPDKVNIASIGNVVPDLHIHVTCRRRGDVSWPGPCYGAAPQVPFSEGELPEAVARLRRALPPPTLLHRLTW